MYKTQHAQPIIKPERCIHTKESIIQNIRDFYSKHKREPFTKDFCSKNNLPSTLVVYRHFDTITAAKISADIKAFNRNLPKTDYDSFIKANYKQLTDKEIAKELSVPIHLIRYRRLTLKLYKYTERLKPDYIGNYTYRKRAIKKYGNKCELCTYKLYIEVHHIIPRTNGGSNKLSNLMVVCANCHKLITHKILIITNRNDIKKAKHKLNILLNDPEIDLCVDIS